MQSNRKSKISSFLYSFLFISFYLLIVYCQFGCQQKGGASSSSNNSNINTPQGNSQDDIVYINSDSLLEKYDYYKKVKQTLEDKTKSLQIDAEQKQTRFQSEVQAYQKNAFNLTPAEKSATEQRLGKEKQQIEEFQQGLSQELAQESQEKNDKLYAKIKQFLSAYADTHHYKIILGYSDKGGAVLYARPGMEITQEVIKGLNEAYAKEK